MDKKRNDSEDEFISYNISKFLNDKTNIILITGFSGSGKSTIAEKYKYKYDMVHIELDLIDPSNEDSKNLLNDELKSDSTEVFYNFIDENEYVFDAINKSDTSKETLDKIMTSFIPYCIKWCLDNDYNDYVIEGTEIYEYPELIDKTLPIIIMKTSAEESMKRLYHRDDINHEEICSEDNIKKLENFEKSLK